MKKLAVICSEFNKDLVEELYQSALLEFENYKKSARQSIQYFSGNSPHPLNLDYIHEDLKFVKNFSEVKRHTESESSSKEPKKIVSDFVKYMLDWEIDKYEVPGAGEIPTVAKELIKSQTSQKSEKSSAILALGLVIRGETSHYDFLSDLLRQALWDLQKSHSLPIVFSVLMTENKDQAKARTKRRGAEAMNSLLQMMEWFYLNKA